MTCRLAVLCICVALGACATGDEPRDAGRGDVEALERHVQERAAPLLERGRRLTVEIVALDRAGSPESWRKGFGNTRVVRDVYPARIDLRFRLVDTAGTLVTEGERSLRDLPVSGAARYGQDPLRYERALLDDWLERELGRAAR